MVHIVNGKTAILLKTLNNIRTALNQVIEDVKQMDNTIGNLVTAMNTSRRKSRCKMNTIHEFLGYLSAKIMNLLLTVFRLLEAEDILRQAKRLEGKTLVSYVELPSFVTHELSRQLQVFKDMSVTSRALEMGYPLLIEPLLEYKHIGTHSTATWLAQLVRCQSAVREARIRFPAGPTLRVLK